MTSKAAEPGPTIIAACSSMTWIEPSRSASPTTARPSMCRERFSFGMMPPR